MMWHREGVRSFV